MSRYKYEKLTLTGAMVEDLIVELLPSNIPHKRSHIARTVISAHLSRGGLDSVHDLTRTVKGALTKMKAKGIVENCGYGSWRINRDVDPAEEAEVGTEFEDESVLEPEPVVPDYPTYGSGDEAVYLYYYPTYKYLSDLKGEPYWPLKVGRTTVDAGYRIKDQVGTALPEYPVIPYIFRTDSGRLAEALVHTTLEYRGRRLLNSPGKEWFESNPDEVLRILTDSTE